MKVLVQRFEVLEGDFTNLFQLGFSGHLAIRRCDRIDQLSDCGCCVAVATSELIVHQRIFERAERVGAVLASAGKQSRADLRRSGGVLTAVSPIKILCSGLIPLQGCWLHRCHLSSCCFDDKAKPLREWRWSSSDSSETPPPSLRVFSFRLNRPNALLLAPRVRGARSHSRDTPHLYSACAVSKSARKPFVIKIEQQPVPMALKERAGRRGAVPWPACRNGCIQKHWPLSGDLVMKKIIKMFIFNEL